MSYGTTGGDTDSHQLNQLKGQVEQVKNVMKDNIDKACMRGDQLNDLDVRADNLNEDAELFQKQAVQMKRKYRNKNYKLWAILICIILVIVLVIAGLVGGLLGCHFSSKCPL